MQVYIIHSTGYYRDSIAGIQWLLAGLNSIELVEISIL